MKKSSITEGISFRSGIQAGIAFAGCLLLFLSIYALQPDISKSANQVIRATVNELTDDLIFYPVYMGTGIDEEEAKSLNKEAEEHNQLAQKGWEQKIGNYFADRKLNNYLSTTLPVIQPGVLGGEGAASFALTKIEPVEKTEYTETIKVFYQENESDETAVFLFHYDTNGLITSVEIL